MTDNKEARNCCPQCLSGNDVEPRKCHLLSDHQGLQEYHNGQKWLSQCQECECLVRILSNLFWKPVLKIFILEWWNWLLAIGMSPRFLPSSHSKAWPLLSSMPWWRWGPSPRRPCVGQRLSKHLVIIMLTYGPWIQKWPILGAGGVQMHVMPMSGKCQTYLVNLHFTNICRYHIKYVRRRTYLIIIIILTTHWKLLSKIWFFFSKICVVCEF